MPTRPAWFDPTLFPVESRWLDVDGHQVHYVDEGDGPVLLMLHGNPTWSFLYRRLIAGLSDRFRCVAPDLPGFGLSSARGGYGFTAAEHSAVVRRFVEALGLTDVTPVVQDWGGPIGLGAVVAEPERYRALVVGNTWAWPSSASMRRFSAVMGGPWTGELVSQRLNLFVGQLIPRVMRRRTLTAGERTMYRGPFPTVESRVPVRVFPRELVTAEPFLADLESRLGVLAEKPALLLWADKDIAFHAPERRRWQALLPDRRDHVLHGAGHYWQDDAGEEAVLVIRDWWADRQP